MLSHFSHVPLCATLWTAAYQAPLSLEFSRQEYWSELPFPSPLHACMLSRFSHVPLCATLWTAAHQASLSTGLSRQEHWSGLPFPSPYICILVGICTHPYQIRSVAQSCPTLCDPWIAARQASLSITNSWSSLRLTSIESVMPSSHLILSSPSPPAPNPSQHAHKSVLEMIDSTWYLSLFR